MYLFFPVRTVRRLLVQQIPFRPQLNRQGSGKKVIEDLSFKGLIEYWRTRGFKQIITMVGAGISTSAGVPDFRSPGSGLYMNLNKYNLPYPSAIFELDYFRINPKPFFSLVKELYPGNIKPTPCHYFIRLLYEKGFLLRHYTQNIDNLERVAGIPEEKLVEAHGNFYSNHCLNCSKYFSMEWMKERVFADVIPTCDECSDLVKPDIVFYGENLPDKFFKLPDEDFAECDLLIIMGTSLEVFPFASLVGKPNSRCIRLLINREKVGQRDSFFQEGLKYDSPSNKRDVAWIGECDAGVSAVAELIGYGQELRELINKGYTK